MSLFALRNHVKSCFQTQSFNFKKEMCNFNEFIYFLRNHVKSCFQTQSFNCFQTGVVLHLLSKQL